MNIKEKLLLLIKGSKDKESSEPKQKKVREKKITRLHLILAGLALIVLLVLFIVIKVKINNKDNIYHNYEKELVLSANTYYRTNHYDIKDGTVEKLDIKKLISGGFVNIDSKLINKCEGYVESTSAKDYNSGKYEITRRAYIKCGSKYKTINYISD